jgi:hypothetical protein
VHFAASQQNQIQKPDLIHLAEVDLLRVSLYKGQDVLLPNAMDVLSISVVPFRTLGPIV